jgi:hypothetical protein
MNYIFDFPMLPIRATALHEGHGFTRAKKNDNGRLQPLRYAFPRPEDETVPQGASGAKSVCENRFAHVLTYAIG